MLFGFSTTSTLNSEYLLNETWHNRTRALESTKGLLHCPKISRTLVQKRPNTRPQFLPSLTVLFRPVHRTPLRSLLLRQGGKGNGRGEGRGERRAPQCLLYTDILEMLRNVLRCHLWPLACVEGERVRVDHAALSDRTPDTWKQSVIIHSGPQNLSHIFERNIPTRSTSVSLNFSISN